MSLASSKASTPSRWFGSVTERADSTRMFLFPFAGGIAAAFLEWQALLGQDVELHVALLPGRGARLHEAPMYDLDELVDQLTGAIADLADRPFLLYGHSLGALVAFEVAHALRRRGVPGLEALWVGGAEGPQTRLIQRRFHELGDADLVEALRDFGATPAELLADPEMMELLLPGIRADFALAERYRYTAETPLDVPIHVLLGDQDRFVDIERAQGWARESTVPVRQHIYPGGHFFMEEHRGAIATLLVDTLGMLPAAAASATEDK